MAAEHFPIPWRSSLIVRSLFSQCVFLLLICAGALYFSAYRLESREIDTLKQDSRYMLRLMTKSLDVALWNLDQRQVVKQLEAFSDVRNFCGARVRDAQGAIFAARDFPPEFDATQIVLSESITFNNPMLSPPAAETIGTLDVCISTGALYAQLRQTFAQQALFLLFITGAALVGAYASLMILARPLTRIRGAMGRLASSMEPISDAQLLKPNEIGALSHSFNQMVAGLDRAYRQLEEAKHAAEGADRAKSDFLANTSHELRTPLNSIIGMAQLLLENSPDGDERDMLQTLEYAAQTLLEIVNDILDISKIETGSIELESVPFSPQESVARVVNMLLPLASKKGLSLQLHIRYKEQLMLLGDPLRFVRVVTNLVTNAIKYTDAGGVDVYLSAQPQPDGKLMVAVDVADTGVGIPPDKLPVIFDKFVQVDASSTRKQGGSGLGLTITKQLVQRMGGTIAVRSTLGEGSVFSVSVPFPAAPEQAPRQVAAARRQAAQANALASQIRVLVAEDHVLNQAYMKRLLPSLGITQFSIVDNGQAALDAVVSKEADFIFMDCHMPVLDGYEAARRIREHEKQAGGHIPIVAMTANAMEGEREKCLQAGMDEYISKPIDKTVLVIILSQWMRFITPETPSAPAMPTSPGDAVLDLRILSGFTENNPQMEREFVSIFMKQSTDHLQKLVQACVDGVSVDWKEAAHSLKGGAATLGAMKMRAVCAQAQEMVDSTREARLDMVQAVTRAFQEVCQELRARQLL